jgi:hypothetical protein
VGWGFLEIVSTLWRRDKFSALLECPALRKYNIIYQTFFYMAQQPPVGQGLLIHEVSRSQSTSSTVGRTPLDEIRKLLKVLLAF